MSSKRSIKYIAVAALAGVIIVIIALWGMCILCSYMQRPPNDTTAPPDYYYSYDLAGNGTIDQVTISSFFTFVYRNDVRFVETSGSDLEVKLWGRYMIPVVTFEKNGSDLAVTINVNCGIDNDYGSPYGDEYIYLPDNWTYTIVSNNQNGNTQVGNSSWNYTKTGK